MNPYNESIDQYHSHFDLASFPGLDRGINNGLWYNEDASTITPRSLNLQSFQRETKQEFPQFQAKLRKPQILVILECFTADTFHGMNELANSVSAGPDDIPFDLSKELKYALLRRIKTHLTNLLIRELYRSFVKKKIKFLYMIRVQSRINNYSSFIHISNMTSC